MSNASEYEWVADHTTFDQRIELPNGEVFIERRLYRNLCKVQPWTATPEVVFRRLVSVTNYIEAPEVKR